MNATRQDAWTQDEDIILAETVLQHIREGKTQLEAFKEVAKQLSRTSAACGFRWNATIRKHYQDAIQYAKEERKQGDKKQSTPVLSGNVNTERDTIETAISLLEKMRTGFMEEIPSNKLEQEKQIERLKQENDQLRQQLQRYDNAWKEMGKLWGWVKTGSTNS
ncbi:RsfA family transcriptional regulator [Oceanobacillus kapialis]|uniref:RsfA family transcriptional regulator n=1 Tax=Oceanobacillus kapialis TaxID=481353 RepID=A0ABW5PYF3_9BACI